MVKSECSVNPGGISYSVSEAVVRSLDKVERFNINCIRVTGQRISYGTTTRITMNFLGLNHYKL